MMKWVILQKAMTLEFYFDRAYLLGGFPQRLLEHEKSRLFIKEHLGMLMNPC